MWLIDIDSFAQKKNTFPQPWFLGDLPGFTYIWDNTMEVFHTGGWGYNML